MTAEPQIRLFRSLFRGRGDVYAMRWENGERKGYAPAYISAQKEQYAPLTDQIIHQHLQGDIVVGIYPLLKDHHVYFGAADFDKGNWKQDSLNFLRILQKYGLPAYLERSRSGNGAHVWIFFREAIPAQWIRQIFIKLLELALNKPSQSSFDRIFPNQDFLKEGGLGNLIALPLQGKSVQNQNNVFLNPKTFAPFPDQWEFLRSIQRIGSPEIQRSLEILGLSTELKRPKPPFTVEIGACIKISRSGLPKSIKDWLVKATSIPNPAHFIRKRMGKSTFSTPKFLSIVQPDLDHFLLPFGLRNPFFEFCRTHHFEPIIRRLQVSHPKIEFQASFQLTPTQKRYLEEAMAERRGVIVLPPGSGKTIIGMAIIAKHQKRALIIVNRRSLLQQWRDRVERFLGIPREEIGELSGKRKVLGEKITIAMVQTLARSQLKLPWKSEFGTVIVDECHHAAAPQFHPVLLQLQAHMMIGLTATPTRKQGDEQFMYTLMGPQIQPQPTATLQLDWELPFTIHIRHTHFQLPAETASDNFAAIGSALALAPNRNALLISDVQEHLERGAKCLVLTERRNHVDQLAAAFPDIAIALHGGQSPMFRQKQVLRLQQGDYSLAIATGQLLGEGLDFLGFDVLFLPFPLASEGKLIQYIGRAQRGGIRPQIIDYRDRHVELLEKMFQKRLRVYRKWENA